MEACIDGVSQNQIAGSGLALRNARPAHPSCDDGKASVDVYRRVSGGAWRGDVAEAVRTLAPKNLDLG